jgi:hypothetical protein
VVWGYNYQVDDPGRLVFADSLETLVFSLHAGYFAARGFLMEEDPGQDAYSLTLDYASLVRSGKPRLADLVRSFRDLSGQLGDDRERLLAALTAFCQEYPTSYLWMNKMA